VLELIKFNLNTGLMQNNYCFYSFFTLIFLNKDLRIINKYKATIEIDDENAYFFLTDISADLSPSRHEIFHTKLAARKKIKKKINKHFHYLSVSIVKYDKVNSLY
jgi:hypothetical protein